ncbi:MAG: dihydroorotate dehydrogenase electron transfer subunit [Microbacter sp.]
MQKKISDWILSEKVMLNPTHFLLKFKTLDSLPVLLPGQFVQLKIDDNPSVFLRRTFSIHYVDVEKQEIWLLIQTVGEGTTTLSEYSEGKMVNVIYPLGNSFSIPDLGQKKLLLIGGGVGIAPMLFLGSTLHQQGFSPNFLIGAKSRAHLLELNEFEKFGQVYVTTEDGSAGEKGFVTDHSILNQSFDQIYTCGPTPMMKAVAAYAASHSILCELSLENKMACGIGACLCCVTETHEGNTCVCTEGPVFKANDLVW